MSLIGVLAMSLILATGPEGASAPRSVYHVSRSSASVIFSTCGNVRNGDLCSFTVIFASAARPVSFSGDQEAGSCIWLDRITGHRDGPRGIVGPSTDIIGQECGSVRVTIAHSLDRATVTGTLDMRTCTWTDPDPCRPAGTITIDLAWQGLRRTTTLPPRTMRYSDYSEGLPCVYHTTQWRYRPALATGTIPEFGDLGTQAVNTSTLSTGGSIWIGQNVGSCID